MKMYSNDAVTSKAVNELDEKQSREIEKLKLYCALLLAGEVVIFGITVGLYLLN